MKSYRSLLALAVAAGVGAGVIASPAMAERDPAYAAARAAGLIGEKPDGYLGIVGEETPELRRIVNSINIQRRTIYVRDAKESRATLEAYAITVGCDAISRTVPGEKYKAPDGSWRTRTNAPPVRDPRCR